MRRLNLRAALLRWQYPFKLRLLFPVIGICIVFYLYKREINRTNTRDSKEHLVEGQYWTDDKRHTFETGQEENRFPEKQNGKEQRGDRGEPRHSLDNEVKLIADVKQLTLPGDNVDTQGARKDTLPKDNVDTQGARKDTLPEDNVDTQDVRKDTLPKDNVDTQGARKDTLPEDNVDTQDVRKDTVPKDNVDTQGARTDTTFSPKAYPYSVNLTGIVRQYDMKGFADVQPINNFNYSYIVNPDHICKGLNRIRVLFIVKSSPEHTLTRTIIRDTWANMKRFPSIRIIFSFGTPKHITRLQALLDESSTHNDILIVKDYVDDYYNLTLKTISGLRWAVTHCARVQYVVSADDDMHVAPDLLLSFLDRPDVRKVDNLFSGHLLIDTKPIRNPKDKWMVSMSEYPFQNYPSYIFGGFVIMSMSTVRTFTVAAMYTKLFKFEDVYLGILAAKVGIEATNNGYVNSRKTFTVSESFKTLIASHFYNNPKDLQRAWDCHLSILDQNEDKSVFCDYVGKRLHQLKSEIDSIVGWMENVKFNS